MFTGEPTLARAVIAEQSSILALSPDALRALVASSTELGDLLLRTMITRRALTATMSRYLIDRIEAAENVEIWEGCEVKALHGGDELEAVTLVGRDQSERRLDTTALFAMIGASPRTEDVVGLVGLDEKIGKGAASRSTARRSAGWGRVP